MRAPVSWFFMISAPLLLIYAVFPLPAFLFGVLITGVAARLIYVVFAAVSFATGYGFFRLRSEARILLVAWLAFGFLNMLAVFSPWGARNFHAYLDTFTPGYAASAPNPFAATGFLLFALALSAAFYGFVFWLVHRHRSAFTPLPPPPPAPLLHAPFSG